MKKKLAFVTMKQGELKKENVEAALKDTRYSVSSFKEVLKPTREYTLNVSGMT